METQNKSYKNENKSYALSKSREYKGEVYPKIELPKEITKLFGCGSETRFFVDIIEKREKRKLRRGQIVLTQSGGHPPF